MDPYQHIEDYIAGNLSEEKQKQMEDAMLKDDGLRSLVENYYETKEVASDILEDDLSEMVSRVEDNLKTEKSNFSIKWLWLGILSLFLLCIIYAVWNHGKSDERYFADNYVRPESKDVVRSGNPEEMDLLAQGKYFFELNEFSKAENVLKSYIEANIASVDSVSIAHYWLGHALINQYKWEKAKEAFSKADYSEAEKYIEIIKSRE